MQLRNLVLLNSERRGCLGKQKLALQWNDHTQKLICRHRQEQMMTTLQWHVVNKRGWASQNMNNKSRLEVVTDAIK